MQDSRCFCFPPFRLELGNERLWRETDAIRLSHKAFGVLRCLITQAGQLVTKDTLFEAVWPDTAVSESVLTVAIRELRQALGDQRQTPQYIETIHRRGYRFIAPVTVETRSAGRHEPADMSRPPTIPTLSPPETFVGREDELAQLQRWIDLALHGKRQIGFISGEAGIGKTALVETFVARVAAETDMRVGHGQCIDHHGVGEAYLPVLDTLGRLCRGPEGDHLLAHLRQQAPSWLVQMPALLSAVEQEDLQRTAGGATQVRMLRELAEALETLTAARPLLLVLEDLHWCDGATLDWLAFVARRREWARLLILATYRPVDAIVRAHPLHTVVQELRQHDHCVELALDYLSTTGVAAYVTQRFEAAELPVELPQAIHQRTNGNPLFMVNVVNDMLRQDGRWEGSGAWDGSDGIEAVLRSVPENLRQLIEQQLEQLSPAEQAILEAVSVAGAEFSAAAVAAGVDREVENIEARCAILARREQFVRTCGVAEWPDGTVAGRYSFIHALYQEVLYDQVPAGRRVRVHQQIGIRQEAGYGEQARNIAAELAMHFVQGRDTRRALQYLQYAGENALRRSAHQQAIAHLTRGLEVLRALPDSPERAPHELALHATLGPALIAIKGWSAPEVEHVYARARVLCQQTGETPHLCPVLWGLRAFYTVRDDPAWLGTDCSRTG